VGIPSLTPKPVVGIPNWLRQNVQQWAYQAGLVRVGIPTTLYKRDLRFSGYDAADNSVFSLLYGRIKPALTPITGN